MHVMFSSTQSGQTFPLDLGLDKLMISLQKHNAWNADPIPEVLRTCPTIFYPYATYETTYVSHANQWKYYINIYNWFNCKITMYIYILYMQLTHHAHYFSYDWQFIVVHTWDYDLATRWTIRCQFHQLHSPMPTPQGHKDVPTNQTRWGPHHWDHWNVPFP